MDALSDVLRVVHLTGGVFLHGEFHEPWCMAAQLHPDLCSPILGASDHLILYHYVAEGTFTLQVAGEAPVTLEAGEVVLMPHNDMHLMGSDIALTPVPAGDIIQLPEDRGLYSINFGGDGPRTRLVCGFLGCDNVENNPVITTLPPYLTLKIEEGGSTEWIRSTFQYAADEVARGRPGSETVLAKLSELLFVEAVRRYAESLPASQTGWLAGLADPYVSKSLALLHDRIDHHWTIDQLSREVGLSRSALTDRFAKLVGLGPMQYLANWRMQVAAQRLRKTNHSLAQIAQEVGYESEAAFSRAFKKAHNIAPATWRREAV